MTSTTTFREKPWRLAMAAVIATAMTLAAYRLGSVPEAHATGEEGTLYIGYEEQNCEGEQMPHVKSMEELQASRAISYKTNLDRECKKVSRGVPPLDLGTTTVIGRRITPSIPSFSWPPPRPRATPIAIYIPLAAPRPQAEEEEEAIFRLGRCSKPLRSDYGGSWSEDLSPEDRAKISSRLSRHDDVLWEKVGQQTNAAGFFPKSFAKALLTMLPLDGEGTDGEIRIPSPLPSSGDCNSYDISEAVYNEVVRKVSTDTRNPPSYHLITYNCQNWADDIHKIASRRRMPPVLP